jgi:hypothetical protein
MTSNKRNRKEVQAEKAPEVVLAHMLTFLGWQDVWPLTRTNSAWRKRAHARYAKIESIDIRLANLNHRRFLGRGDIIQRLLPSLVRIKIDVNDYSRGALKIDAPMSIREQQGLCRLLSAPVMRSVDMYIDETKWRAYPASGFGALVEKVSAPLDELAVTVSDAAAEQLPHGGWVEMQLASLQSLDLGYESAIRAPAQLPLHLFAFSFTTAPRLTKLHLFGFYMRQLAGNFWSQLRNLPCLETVDVSVFGSGHEDQILDWKDGLLAFQQNNRTWTCLDVAWHTASGHAERFGLNRTEQSLQYHCDGLTTPLLSCLDDTAPCPKRIAFHPSGRRPSFELIEQRIARLAPEVDVCGPRDRVVEYLYALSDRADKMLAVSDPMRLFVRLENATLLDCTRLRKALSLCPSAWTIGLHLHTNESLAPDVIRAFYEEAFAVPSIAFVVHRGECVHRAKLQPAAWWEHHYYSSICEWTA